jgi:hypothetical protein
MNGEENNNFYFCCDEPDISNDNILCGFHISNIKKKRAFFFIVEKSDKLFLKYSLISSKEFVSLLQSCVSKMNDGDYFKSIDVIVQNNEYKELYSKKYTKLKEIINKEHVKRFIGKFKNEDFTKVNNTILGLDGFSVELKLTKNVNLFHSWCCSNDEKHFYILDFVNEILDFCNIEKKYRFSKIKK